MKQKEESSFTSVNTLIGGGKKVPTEFRYVVRQGMVIGPLPDIL